MKEYIDIGKIRVKQKKQETKKIGNEKGFWDRLNRDIQFPGMGGLPDRVKEYFYLELSSLLEAGVDMRNALELIISEQRKKKNKLTFEKILRRVVSGETLSQSLHSDHRFSKYEYYSVQIGEETGKLLIVLKDLSFFFKKKIIQQRQLIGALTYPMVILVVAIAAVTFMLSYVVPMFSDIFKRFGNDLPAITKFVISMSEFIKESFLFALMLVAILITASFWQRDKKWFRSFTSRFALHLPLAGSIIQKIFLARFSGTMSLLIGSKVPLVQAIQLARQMIRFYPLEISLFQIEEDVVVGKSLHSSLSSYAIFPPKMISMIRVGEEVNQLEKFFTRLADQYNNEVEYQTTLIGKFLEPLIIVILGLLVGVILIAMYLPLFKLGQTF